MMPVEQGVRVGRLTVRASDRDRAALVRSAVTRTRLQPAGLGPSAVLVVRRLVETRPAEVEWSGPEPVNPALARAVTDQLEWLLRHAARPAAGPVPLDAAAVLFVDRSELLAALAADFLAGQLAIRWWWRALGTSGASDTVLRTWSTAPRYVPAALELLGSRAVDFSRALPEPSATALATDVAAAFGAPRLRPAAAPGIEGAAVRARPETVHGPRRRDRPRPARGDPTAAPWEPLVTEAAGARLSPGQQLFLGIGLALRRAPTLVHRPAFWLAVRAWLDRATSVGVASPIDARPAGRTEPAISSDPAGFPARRGAGAPESPSPTPRGAERALGHRGDTSDRHGPGSVPAGDTARRRTAPDVEAVPGRRAGRRPNGPVRETASPGPGTGTRPGHVPDALAADEPSATAPPSVAGATATHGHGPEGIVQTDLGGLFYLLNFAQYLGLYGDFTTPAEPGIALDPWDLVTLLGRRLLEPAVPADPVWELLRVLACRPTGEPPGRGFDPPADWRIPPAWLEPFEPAGPWAWSAAGGRLRLGHPAGFPVLDVGRTAAPPAAQLDHELVAVLGGTARPPLRRRGQPRRSTDPLRRWTASFAGYTGARLTRALGPPPAEAIRMLLCHRARVRATPAHVDVEFSLTALPIEVRLAGLDRDPGWIPAAGRAVAFHFD